MVVNRSAVVTAGESFSCGEAVTGDDDRIVIAKAELATIQNDFDGYYAQVCCL